MIMKATGNLYIVSEDTLKRLGVKVDSTTPECVDLEKAVRDDFLFTTMDYNTSYPAVQAQIADLLRQRKALKKESLEYYRKYLEVKYVAEDIAAENRLLHAKLNARYGKTSEEMEGGEWG